MRQSPKNNTLYRSIRSLILEAQGQIVRNVNSTMTVTYFQIGRYIAENELQGKGRADYAEAAKSEWQHFTAPDNKLRYSSSFLTLK